MLDFNDEDIRNIMKEYEKELILALAVYAYSYARRYEHTITATTIETLRHFHIDDSDRNVQKCREIATLAYAVAIIRSHKKMEDSDLKKAIAIYQSTKLKVIP